MVWRCSKETIISPFLVVRVFLLVRFFYKTFLTIVDPTDSLTKQKTIGRTVRSLRRCLENMIC